MASIWKLPVLFVCENNQFATEVANSYAAGNPNVASRGAAYGIPGIEVDGNDVLSVHHIAGEAIQWARTGGGPTLIECKTYRTRAHAEGMGDFTYRTREDVEEWKTRDPISRLRNTAIAKNLATASALDQIDQEVQSLISESLQFAESSPWPDPATATRHVYAAEV